MTVKNFYFKTQFLNIVKIMLQLYENCIYNFNNISENFEGNVNFENLKGRSNDAICFKTFGVHVFVAIYHYYDYIFLNENDARVTI